MIRADIALSLIRGGVSIEKMAERHEVPAEVISETQTALEELGISRGLETYTVDQAAVVLGVSPRRTRSLCQEGRIGTRFGKRSYAISRAELINFAKRERSSGIPGQVQRAAER